MDNKLYKDNINKELEWALTRTKEFCKNNSNIIYTKADKRNITVALEKIKYTDSINEMFKDSTTYEIIVKNPVKNMELTLNNMLKSWFSLGYISKQQL